jgi:hypothetical protein
MSLVQKLPDGGWVGLSTGRHYYPPQENEYSANAQERQHARSQPLQLQMPKDVKPGSAEYIRMQIQEEALSNVQRAQLQEAGIAGRAFIANHPELLDNDHNLEQLCEYFALQGVPVVKFNDANIPLATSVDDWERAYFWKVGMGTLQFDPAKMSVELQGKISEAAVKANEQRMLHGREEEAAMETMPLNELEARARGWR